MKVRHNKYGDYLVQRIDDSYLQNKDKKIVLENKHPILFKGFDESNKPLNAEYLIVDSPKYGKLYGNYEMKKEHPMVVNDTILSSCLVSFFKKDGVYYTVLVRNKIHGGVMNARGSLNDDEDEESCAKREFLEETYIYPTNIKKIGEWRYDTYFANLKWDGICNVYYTELDESEICYKYHPDKPVATPVDNKEIDAVIICPVKKLNVLGNISTHHVEAVIKSICDSYTIQPRAVCPDYKSSKRTNHLKSVMWNTVLTCASA